MKKLKYAIFFLPTIILSFVFAFNFSFAQTDLGGATDTGTTTDTGMQKLDFSLINPIDDSINDIPTLIEKIIEVVAIIAVPVLTLMIIYTGFLFVQARGNKTKLEDAKRSLGYTLLGAAIIIGAWTLAQVVGGTVDCLKPGAVC